MSPTNGGCIHVDGCNCFARLQAALTEAEGEVTRLGTQTIVWASWLQMRDERDHYKALAERRGAAAARVIWRIRLLREHGYSDPIRQHDLEIAIAEAEAAIDATPEAREKERR